MTIVKGLTLSKIYQQQVSSLLLQASNWEKKRNFFIFCQILMIFLPKCRPFYVVLEKGHGAREKGHGAAPC